jgi:peptidoglycan/LPS O-acetylase OafA/YrhL
VCSALRFHSHFTYPWTLNFFAIAAALWIEREICYALTRPPPRVLEWAGAFSYAIYVVHVQGQTFIRDHWHIVASSIPGWLFVNAGVLLGAYVFYRLVEKPSHRLARHIYRTLMMRRSDRVAGASA